MRKSILLIFCIMTLIGLSGLVSASKYTSGDLVACEDDMYAHDDFNVNEGFEGTGTPSGWTAGDSPNNFDYTTTVFNDSEALSGSSNDVSFPAQVKSGVVTYELYAYSFATNANWYPFYLSNSLRFWFKNNAKFHTHPPDTDFSTSYSASVWYKMVIVANYTSSKVSFYLYNTTNGNLIESRLDESWTQTGTNPWIMGLTSNGVIDNFRVYNGTVCPSVSPNITIESCMSSGDTTEPYTTSDTTPTFNVTTDINSYCRIGDTNTSYSSMGISRNCTTTGTTSHICTLTVQDELMSSTDYVYISCDSSYDGSAYNSTEELTMNITQLETNSSKAIEEGINSSDIYPATIYRNQQIYIRSLNNTQKLATVDRVAVKGDKRWLLNYVIDSGSLLGLFNITPAVYVWDKTDLAMNTIRSEVSGLINSTYP